MLSQERKTRQQSGIAEKIARTGVHASAQNATAPGQRRTKTAMTWGVELVLFVRLALRAGECALEGLLQGGTGPGVFGLGELTLLVLDLEGEDLLLEASQQHVARHRLRGWRSGRGECRG